MEAWPFSDEDWASVEDAVVELINVSEDDDDELIAARLKDVFDLLEALAIKYGPHPVLYETKADFLVKPEERVELYKEAIALADMHSFETVTIRLSLARVLIEDFSDYDAAKSELDACIGEVIDEDLDEWKELMDLVNKNAPAS